MCGIPLGTHPPAPVAGSSTPGASLWGRWMAVQALLTLLVIPAAGNSREPTLGASSWKLIREAAGAGHSQGICP